ncbi:uncharacterized protein LOC121857001 [Homarus americanus]|uniref:uncharacterized protein LOC121857001 n=1 Tax=Homarus americanus TaxID=6706 RepID=UPI001C44DAEE|nr:uncharacterized protein LOC121857001 [Homarus americanus]
MDQTYVRVENVNSNITKLFGEVRMTRSDKDYSKVCFALSVPVKDAPDSYVILSLSNHETDFWNLSVKGIEPEVMGLLIQFVYWEKFIISKTYIQHFISRSKSLQLLGSESVCENLQFAMPGEIRYVGVHDDCKTLSPPPSGIPCAAYGHSTSNITDERQRSMNKAGSSSILQLGRENKAEKGIVQRCEGEAHASNNNVVTQETEMNVRNDIMIRHEMDMKARNNRNILRQREAKASIGMLKKLEERRTKPKIILLQKLKCGSLSPINIANEQGRKFVFKIDGDKGPKEKTKARQGTIVRQKWDDEVGRNAASHQGETQGGHDALLRLQVNAETRDLSPLKQEEIGVSMLSSKEVVPGRLKTVANSCVTKKMKGLQSQKVVHSAHKSCWCSCKEQNPKSSLEDKSAVLDFTTYGTKDGIIPNNIAHVSHSTHDAYVQKKNAPWKINLNFGKPQGMEHLLGIVNVGERTFEKGGLHDVQNSEFLKVNDDTHLWLNDACVNMESNTNKVHFPAAFKEMYNIEEGHFSSTSLNSNIKNARLSARNQKMCTFSQNFKANKQDEKYWIHNEQFDCKQGSAATLNVKQFGRLSGSINPLEILQQPSNICSKRIHPGNTQLSNTTLGPYHPRIKNSKKSLTYCSLQENMLKDRSTGSIEIPRIVQNQNNSQDQEINVSKMKRLCINSDVVKRPQPSSNSRSEGRFFLEHKMFTMGQPSGKCNLFNCTQNSSLIVHHSNVCSNQEHNTVSTCTHDFESHNWQSKPSYKNLKEQIKYVAEPPRDVETHSGDAEKDFIVEEWKDKVPENCRVEIHMEMNSQHECNSHKEKQVQVKIVGTDKECKNFTVMKKNNNEFRDKCKENAQVKARHYKTGNGNRDSQTGKVQTLTRFCEKELQENKRCSHLIDEVDGAVRIKDIGKYEQFEKNGLKGQPVKDFTTNDSLLKDIDIKCPSGEDIVVKYSPPKDSGMKETSNKDNNIRDLRIEVNSSSTGSNCASAIVDTDNGVNCLPGKDLPIRDSDGKDPSLDIKEPDTSVEGDGIKDQPVEDDGKTSLVDESVNYRPFGNSDLKDLQYEDRGLNHTLLTDDSTKHLPVDESNKKHLSVKGSYLKTPPVDSFQKKYLPDNELGQNISQNRNGMKDLLVKNLVSTTICAENNDLMKTQQKKHPTKVCEAGRVTTKEEVLMVRGKDKCQDDPIVENPGIGCDGHVEERDSAEGQSELQKTLIDDKGKHGERNMQINVGKGKVEGTDIGKTQMEDGNDQVNGYQEQMQMDKLHGENGRQVEGGMMKGELKNAGNKKTADKSGNIRLINTSNESHIEVRNCQWENNNGKRKDEFGSRGVMLSLDNDNVERSYRYKLHSAKILPGHHNIVTNTKDIGNIVPQEQIGLAERTASLENGKNYSINTNGTSSQIPNKSYSHDPISIGKSSKIYHFKSKSRPRVPGGNTSRRETWKDSLMMNHEKKKKSGPVVEINRSEEVHHLSTRTQKSLKKSNEGFLKRKGKKSIRVKKTVYVKHENVDMAGDTCCHTHDVQFSDSTITSRIECIKKSGEYIQISSPRGSGEDSRRVTEESFIMDEEMLPDVTWGKFEDEIEFIVVGDTTNTGGMNGTHGYLLSSKMSAALGVESIVKSEEFFATPESPGSPVNLSNERNLWEQIKYKNQKHFEAHLEERRIKKIKDSFPESVRCENHSNRSQAVSCRQEGEKCPEKVISDTQELHSLKRNCAEEAPRGNNLESSDLSIKSLSNSLSITSHKQGTKESNRHEVISHERETVNESWSLVINHEGDGPGSTGAKFTVELGAISVNNREYSLISPQQDQRTSQEVMKFDVLNKSISLQDTEQSCNIETQQVNDEGVQCIICSDMFVTINEMVSHFRDAHIENRFFMVCPALNCSARIANNKMNSHIRNHVIIQKHKCPHCSFSTSARASLGRHLTIHKQQKLLFHNEVQEGDCDTHHLGRALSNESFHSGSETKPVHCCSRTWSTVKDLQDHFRECHMRDIQNVPCLDSACPVKLWGSNMDSHLRCHILQGEYKCQLCTYSSNKATALRVHGYAHNKARMVDKKFPSRQRQKKLLKNKKLSSQNCKRHTFSDKLSTKIAKNDENLKTFLNDLRFSKMLYQCKKKCKKSHSTTYQDEKLEYTKFILSPNESLDKVTEKSYSNTGTRLEMESNESSCQDIQLTRTKNSLFHASKSENKVAKPFPSTQTKRKQENLSSQDSKSSEKVSLSSQSFQKYKFGKRESQSLTDGQVTDTTKSRKIKSKLNIVAPSGCKRKYFFKKSKLAKKSYSESNKPVKNVCRGENKDFGRIEEIRNICTIDKSNSSQTIPETSSQPPCKDGKILTEDVDAQQAPQLDGKSNNLGNYSCPLCVDCYETPDKLVYHYISSHPYHSPYTCTFEGCPVVLQKRDSSRHLIGHIYEKAFKCPLCSYSHQNLHMLKNHLFCHSQVLEKLQLKEIVDLQIKGPSGDVSVYLNGETVRKRLKRKLNSSIDDQRPTKLQKVDDSLSAEGTQDIEEQGVLQVDVPTECPV